MFSVVVAGRLPLPAPQQIDETHAVFPLENATTINHVVVFMTGQQAFPAGFAATVHLNYKSSARPQEEKWILLGCLKNEKPSAIFRIKGLTTPPSQQQLGGTASQEGANTISAAIGISIESTGSVDTQMATLSGSKAGSSEMTAAGADGMQTDDGAGGQQLALVRSSGAAMDPASQTAMALAMAPKIANNMFAYLSSFAPDSAPQTVPLLKRWLEQFERKLKGQGIGFLAKSEAE